MLVSFNRLTARQLADVVAIYEESLAAPWEWPVARFYELARTPDGPIQALAALDGEAVAGFIITEYLPGGRLWYIHYFAVRADLRSQGWGARILSACLPAGEAAAQAAGHAGCIGTLLEVEAIDGPPSDADRQQRARRQAFYQRHGAHISGARCPRPPWAPSEMPDFELMFIPMAAWDGRLDDALRYRLIHSLMVEAYATPADAPWLRAALAPFADQE